MRLSEELKLLKLGCYVLSKCIADMIILSMSTGKFPTQFKIARVTPVFKNKGRTRLPRKKTFQEE